MTTITNIEDVDSFDLGDDDASWYPRKYEGFIITLDDGTDVRIGVTNSASCCENFGHVASADDLSYYIGADFLEVRVTDIRNENYSVDTSYQGYTLFVDVYTSRGVFQLTVYNSHNGYYGHNAIVSVGGQITHQEVL